MEQWRAAVGYEGYYEVSSIGRVRSVTHEIRHWRGGVATKTGQLIKPATINGYPTAHLSFQGRKRMVAVHRLVAEAFLGTSTLQVNHINGIKSDNRPENLEYVTAQGNITHAIEIGLRDHRGERNHKAVLRPTDVATIRTRIQNGDSAPAIARDYGVQAPCIHKIKSGRTWKHLTA